MIAERYIGKVWIDGAWTEVAVRPVRTLVVDVPSILIQYRDCGSLVFMGDQCSLPDTGWIQCEYDIGGQRRVEMFGCAGLRPYQEDQ